MKHALMISGGYLATGLVVELVRKGRAAAKNNAAQATVADAAFTASTLLVWPLTLVKLVQGTA